ncbi:MAG TPA: arsenate reductase ArsC [Candidatus Limnocylindrales bacterium]|nr:arsenate reductase ArsC [Candidatus Limnocylindrales bacterium]
MGDADAAPIRILVLCTGNSCRSILAEALFRELGGPRIAIESAGSQPAGAVNPRTIQVLDEAGIDHAWARSKSMTEFLDQEFDHVLTVCDDAAEACPVFPGPAVRTHWSIPDPAGATGTEEEQVTVYRATLADLRGRIAPFLATLER